MRRTSETRRGEQRVETRVFSKPRRSCNYTRTSWRFGENMNERRIFRKRTTKYQRHESSPKKKSLTINTISLSAPEHATLPYTFRFTIWNIKRALLHDETTRCHRKNAIANETEESYSSQRTSAMFTPKSPLSGLLSTMKTDVIFEKSSSPLRSAVYTRLRYQTDTNPPSKNND